MNNNKLKKYILGFVDKCGIKTPVLIDTEKTEAHIDEHNGKLIVEYDVFHYFYLTDETRTSDRLTDLIDENDLVYNCLSKTIRQVLVKDEKSVYTENTHNDVNNIKRIYKPDSNGNYILVFARD